MLGCGLLEAFNTLPVGFYGLFTALCHLLLLIAQAYNPCSSTSQLSLTTQPPLWLSKLLVPCC